MQYLCCCWFHGCCGRQKSCYHKWGTSSAHWKDWSYCSCQGPCCWTVYFQVKTLSLCVYCICFCPLLGTGVITRETQDYFPRKNTDTQRIKYWFCSFKSKCSLFLVIVYSGILLQGCWFVCWGSSSSNYNLFWWFRYLCCCRSLFFPCSLMFYKIKQNFCHLLWRDPSYIFLFYIRTTSSNRMLLCHTARTH